MAVQRISARATAAVFAIAVAGTAEASTTTHKLIDSVLESGNTGQTLSSGYTTMETAALSCKYASCTVSMSIMQNIGNATCSGQWAIVGLVDGKSVDGGPYAGALPSNGKYGTRDWQGQSTLAYGKHTLAYQINVPCPVNAYQWSVDYILTYP